jgi:hypothetical protein
MRYRNLGRTGIRVSPYALGALMFATASAPPAEWPAVQARPSFSEAAAAPLAGGQRGVSRAEHPDDAVEAHQREDVGHRLI